MPPQLADLGDFLAALRINGVPVGPGEVERLRQLFALQPHLDRDGLKHLLSALLIKTPTQREVFEPLFAEWCPAHVAEWPDESAPVVPMDVSPDPASPLLPLQPEKEPDELKSVLRPWLLAIGVALLCGLLIWWLRSPRPVVVQQDGSKLSTVPRPPKHSVAPNELHDRPVETAWFWQATIDEANIVNPWRLGPIELTLLGLAALAAAFTIWWRYRRRFPDIVPIPYRDAIRRRQPLPPPDRDDSALTSVRERRQMVWRIDQFVSEDLTRRLDLPQTVDATARTGGFVALHFEPAVYNREIWFWQDRQLERETPQAAIDQLCAALLAGGLPARQGRFTDVPDRIDWLEQSGYRPDHEEGHGRQALVVILTDGEGLAHRLGNARHQLATERLLRHLRHWPRLCFVDCSTSGTRLASLLNQYGIETIALEALPQWLGGTVTRTQTTASLGDAFYGDERVWIAALALGGRQISRANAHSLRVALGLRCSPWRVEDVMDAARQSGTPQIDWLMRNASLTADNTPMPGSLAYQALAWWIKRYAEAAQQMHVQENPLIPWSASLASRRWQVSQALLHLYLDPDGAAQRLVELAHGDLKKEIRRHLADYASAEYHGQGSGRHMHYMTWRLADQSNTTRHRLRQLGFAAGVVGDEAVPPLTLPSRLVLAGTLLVLLALTAFGVAGYRWFVLEPPVLIVKDHFSQHEAFRAQTVQLVEPIGGGKFEVTLGSARHTILLTSPAGTEIPVTWEWQPVTNVNALEGSVVMNAGRLAQPIRACSKGWPLRSLVVIATPFEGEDEGASKAARQLAMRLLDKGSADAVLMGEQWEKALPKWLSKSQALNRKTQVLVVLPQGGNAKAAAALLQDHPGPWAVGSSGDFAALARDIKSGDSEAIADVLPTLEIHRQQPMVHTSSGPKKTGPDQHGIEWVHVCPGTFTMGTTNKEEDPMAHDDEIVDPPRTVVLSGFDMAATETTEAQYGGQGLLPKFGVDWEEARNYCLQKIDHGDLPTEAQWEYAARGGSRFPWSFGDEEALFGHYVNNILDVNNLLGVNEVK